MQQQLLKSRNHSPENFGKVCVLGLGATGLAVAKYFISQMPKRVESCHVYAGEKNEFAMKTADKLLREGITVSFDDKTIDQNYDLCVVSPGISNLGDLYKSAQQNCTELISEVELAWRESQSSALWIAVTGTNGKTTTTALIDHICKTAHKRSVAIGNIGNVAIDAVSADRSKSIYTHTDIYVVEVSSYQLASCKLFAPDIAILLNITPDHLKWHGTFEAYADAKISLFKNAKSAIVNTADPITKARVGEIANFESVTELIEIGQASQNIEVQAQGSTHQFCESSQLRILGVHNQVNAQAGAAACLLAGLTDAQIAAGLTSFKPLEHRLEPCGIIAGTKYFNDSKATNVDAVMVALNSFEDGKAIFLIGGRDKETDITQLIDKCIHKLKGVVCFGECAERFYRAFRTQLSKYPSNDDGVYTIKEATDTTKKQTFVLKKAGGLVNAFHDATKMSYPGDNVVLSPACASFDEFSCFEERGDTFKKLVKSFCR